MSRLHTSSRNSRGGAGIIFIFACTTLLATALFQIASAQNVIWSQRFDSGFPDWGIGGEVDPFGDVVVVGRSALDPESDSIWALVVKYNPDGETLWSKTFDSDAILDQPYTCAVDRDGGIIAVGIYSYGWEGGGQVIKFDRNGNLLWVQRPSLSGYDYTDLGAVVVDDSNNIIVAGCAGHNGEPHEPDVLIIKYTPDGEPAWTYVQDFGGSFWEYISALAFDKNRNLIASGNIGDRYYDSDFFTVKFSPEMETIWTRTFDFQELEGATGVICDANNNIFLCGGSSEPQGPYVPVIIKYLPTGETGWVRVYYPPVGSSFAGDIGIDATGNVLVVGGRDDPPQGMTTSCLLLNYSPSGNLNWLWTYRTDVNSWAHDICLSSPDILYLFGVTQDSFGDNPDMLVAKLRYPLGLAAPRFFESPNQVMMLNPTVIARNAVLILSVKQPADYRITLYDLTGREVERLYQGYLGSGEYRLPIKPNLKNGVYLVRIETGGSYQTSKVILAR